MKIELTKDPALLTNGFVKTSGSDGTFGVDTNTYFQKSINNISTNQTLGSTVGTDYVYNVSGTTTVTMPTAVGNTNRYTVKNSGVAVVTINTTSSQTIDGGLTATLSVPNTSLDLTSDGSNWQIN